MALSCSRITGAGLAHVGPDPLDERLPAEVEAGEAFLGEQSLDHVLGGDAGVIGARNPERPAAAHPLEADQHVLHGVVEPVTHVQHRRHVGRRHLDDVGLGAPPRALAASGGTARARSTSVELGLDRRWIVLRGERLAHALWSVARLPPASDPIVLAAHQDAVDHALDAGYGERRFGRRGCGRRRSAHPARAAPRCRG